MAELTRQRLAEIQDRLDASSDGPWHHDAGFVFVMDGKAHHVVSRIDINGQAEAVALTGPLGVEDERSIADAVLIAHARTDLADLVDEVARLRPPRWGRAVERAFTIATLIVAVVVVWGAVRG